MSHIIEKSYPRLLIDKELSRRAVDALMEFIRKKNIHVEMITDEQLRQYKVVKALRRHEPSLCLGNKSWEGLIVSFPGTRKELSSEFVGTPYLRMILYPILDLHSVIRKQSDRSMPCLYLLGGRFNDVFLRKFSFFKSLIPHVIVMTDDLRKCALRTELEPFPTKKADKVNEYYIQQFLCAKMYEEGEVVLPVASNKKIRIGLISYEVPTVAGTLNPERLDILGHDMEDNSLIIFELKGPHADKVELENLFLQGMEHRNWLEENKMAVKLGFDGPAGKRINTRKRVKLVLGFCGDRVPPLFLDLKAQALRRDRHLEIEFCRFIPPERLGGDVKLSSF